MGHPEALWFACIRLNQYQYSLRNVERREHEADSISSVLFCLRLGRDEIGDGPLEHLGRHGDRLRQRGMRVNGEADVMGIGAHLDRESCFRDQVASIWSNDATTNDAIGRLIEQDLGDPFVAPSERDRPDAAQGNTPLPYFTPLALASFSVSPTQATSGSVYATEGMTRASNELLRPATTSAATLPSWTALWASIGWPTTSPIAKMCI
jgi:hypothetical protein